MSIKHTITVTLPDLPEGYELCEREVGMLVHNFASKTWVLKANLSDYYINSDLAIFARPVKKMRRMTVEELTALVPSGLYYMYRTQGPNSWYCAYSGQALILIVTNPDIYISTDGMKSWRKPEVEDVK